MKAYLVQKWCEPEEMLFTDVEEPLYKENEVLVDVHACGVNFPDLLLIQGKYQMRPTRPFIPGAEISGVVSKVGSKVTQFQEGDKVYGASFLGGYAQKVSVPEKNLYHIPQGMSFEEACGFVVTYQSSYFGVIVRGQLQAKETLLVHAGAGGIGTSAIQIGKALGAKVYATVGSEEKIEIAKQAGADLVFNYNDSTWSKKIRKEYGGVDVVIDPVGGEILEKSILCTNFEGRIVVVGFTSGKIAQVATNLLLLNNISLVGLYWNLYFMNFPEKIHEAVDDLHLWYKKGITKPIIYKTFELKDAPLAIRTVTQRKSYGKVVLKIK